jgi:hypothetical protein
MSEAAERIPAGEERAGQACGFCAEPLDAGDAAAICGECRAVHHEACWDTALGCSKSDCFNAPLTRLDVPHGGAPPAREEAGYGSVEPEEGAPQRRRRRHRSQQAPRVVRGARPCVDCGLTLSERDAICPGCHAINTPDGLYHGPTTTFKGARDALIMAIAGLFFCGPVLGSLAISRALAAKQAIKNDPRLSGEGLATAATVIGVLDLLLWLYFLFSGLGGGK